MSKIDPNNKEALDKTKSENTVPAVIAQQEEPKEKEITKKAINTDKQKEKDKPKDQPKDQEDPEALKIKLVKEKKKSNPQDVKKEQKKKKEQEKKRVLEKPVPTEQKKEALVKKKEKKKQDIFSEAVLKSLKSGEKAAKSETDDIENAIQGNVDDLSYKPELPLSISDLESIRSQISSKWNTAAFSGNSENKSMQVTIIILLDRGGNVTDVNPVSSSGGGKTYQVFVESAIRAIRMASPLQNLPAEKYDVWQEIEFSFDASGMIY